MSNPGTTNLLLAAVAVLLVLALAARRGWGRRYSLAETREVTGPDGMKYRVHLTHEDSGAAAGALAELHSRTIRLLRHLRRKYGGAAAPPPRAEATRRLLALYNPDHLAENSPRDPRGDTSYTIDKGAVLAICLRARGKGGGHAIHEMNTLAFVTVHELAHVAIEDLDHPPRFWRAFRFLLEEAAEAGVLEPVDYEKAPEVYCGLTVDYNPLFDPGVRPI